MICFLKINTKKPEPIRTFIRPWFGLLQLEDNCVGIIPTLLLHCVATTALCSFLRAGSCMAMDDS
ncbi:rCG40042 [Rattus norvegicus]|uniref:RCG40042 n=1 Tax=Rattus norvegicus TaxID=10116 RepID=A6I6M4_RAT|nr:rCG40042 [Rattus norvegicus]